MDPHLLEEHLIVQEAEAAHQLPPVRLELELPPPSNAASDHPEGWEGPVRLKLEFLRPSPTASHHREGWDR